MYWDHMYILKDKKPVKETDLIKWSIWMEESNRTVKKDILPKDITVSTVFIGLCFYEKPLLFETMVFGGKLDMHIDRYCTWEEALKGHEEIVKKVKESEVKHLVTNN